MNDNELLRAEIASVAARMIAEDGTDYSTAKRKAAKQITGKIRRDVLPDNAQIEDEVRAYNELFFADTQPARLLHLRKLALQLMEELAPFSPYLTGAVLNGTAGPHSDIHLQLFAPNTKEVEIYLLNKNIHFEVSESPHFAPSERHTIAETLSFLLPPTMPGQHPEGVHLTVYDADDIRTHPKVSPGKRLIRANADTVKRLIQDGVL